MIIHVHTCKLRFCFWCVFANVCITCRRSAPPTNKILRVFPEGKTQSPDSHVMYYTQHVVPATGELCCKFSKKDTRSKAGLNPHHVTDPNPSVMTDMIIVQLDYEESAFSFIFAEKGVANR